MSNGNKVAPVATETAAPAPNGFANAPATQPNANEQAGPPTYGQALEERYGVKGNVSQPQVPAAPQAAIMVTPLTALGRTTARVDCPRCHQAVETKVVKHAGNQAFIWGAVLCLCLGVCLAWIPCVIDDCKDAEHTCSNCNLALATVTAGGAVELSTAARQASQVGSTTTGPTAQHNGVANGGINAPQFVQGQAPVQRQEGEAAYHTAQVGQQQQPVQEQGATQARVVGADGQPTAQFKA